MNLSKRLQLEYAFNWFSSPRKSIRLPEDIKLTSGAWCEVLGVRLLDDLDEWSKPTIEAFDTRWAERITAEEFERRSRPCTIESFNRSA